MHAFFCFVVGLALPLSEATAQGVLGFSNVDPGNPNWSALTRIGSPDGPFAGPAILAQFLVGETADSLAPVGGVGYHNGGIVRGGIGIIAVPGISYYEVAQVQMVAWYGSLWGSSLADVPADQLGKTDIVPVELGSPKIGLPPYPHFTQGAVVPIPEPSTLALAALGAAALALSRGRRGPPAGRPA